MRLGLTGPRSRGWLVTEQGLELRTLVETLFFLLQAHIFLSRTFWQLCGQAGPLLCGREQLEAPGVNSVAWQCGLVGTWVQREEGQHWQGLGREGNAIQNHLYLPFSLVEGSRLQPLEVAHNKSPLI